MTWCPSHVQLRPIAAVLSATQMLHCQQSTCNQSQALHPDNYPTILSAAWACQAPAWHHHIMLDRRMTAFAIPCSCTCSVDEAVQD